MKPVFKSKIGLELVIPLSIIWGTVLFLSIYEQIWPLSVLMLLLMGYFGYLFVSTVYWIEAGVLKVKCGFYKKDLPISNIYKIIENRDPINSPAMSMDRLSLKYGQWETLNVSPKDKIGFVAAILEVNPGIDVIWKKKK